LSFLRLRPTTSKIGFFFSFFPYQRPRSPVAFVPMYVNLFFPRSSKSPRALSRVYLFSRVTLIFPCLEVVLSRTLLLSSFFVCSPLQKRSLFSHPRPQFPLLTHPLKVIPSRPPHLKVSLPRSQPLPPHPCMIPLFPTFLPPFVSDPFGSDGLAFRLFYNFFPPFLSLSFSHCLPPCLPLLPPVFPVNPPFCRLLRRPAHCC